MDITDDVVPKDKSPTHVHAPSAPESVVLSAPTVNRPIIHPVPPSQPRKRKREEDTNEDPANFNRVRIKMRKRRKLDSKAAGGHEPPEKRKWEGEMDIDSVSDSPKRLRPESPAKEKEAATGKASIGSEADIKSWNRSPKGFAFDPHTRKAPPKSEDWMEFYQNLSKPRLEFTSIDEKPSEPATENVTTKKPSRKRSTPQATEEDAKRAGIPAGYSYKNWDPTEEPIMLLGSVFDANSLGKWIYDWTVHHSGPAIPLAEMAGELWLLLIKLAGKTKRADETMSRIRAQSNRDTVEDFLESGERLWMQFTKLLKVCEHFMWKAAKERGGDKRSLSMDKRSGCDFVDTIFGKDRELMKTEKIMTRMRLWSMRFDANCEDILQRPSQ